jgi:hypothetical protein
MHDSSSVGSSGSRLLHPSGTMFFPIFIHGKSRVFLCFDQVTVLTVGVLEMYCSASLGSNS